MIRLLLSALVVVALVVAFGWASSRPTSAERADRDSDKAFAALVASSRAYNEATCGSPTCP